MKKLILPVLLLLSVSAYSQIDTALTYRTPISGQAIKIIQDKYLRARNSLWIPFTNSTTPSLNGTVDRAGNALQLLSNNRLAISSGGAVFSQYMSVTELLTTLSFKANTAGPSFSGVPSTPTPASNINTTQIVNGTWVNTYYAPLIAPIFTGGVTIGSTNANSLVITNTQNSAAGAGSGIFANSNDGAAMGADHRLGFYAFGGYDGAIMRTAAIIESRAESLWSSGVYPAFLSFETTASGTRSEKMRIKGNGTIVFNNVSEYADNAAALTGGLSIGSVYRTGDLLKIVH